VKKSTRAAKLLGKLGGETTSAAKAEASRANGTKGGRPRKRTEELTEDLPPTIGPALEVLNQLEDEGIIQQPTIAGSVALMYYAQPMYTDDLDMFCYLPNQGILTDLEPIYKRLAELGCTINNMYIRIEGVNVLFMIPETLLEKEAVQNAAAITVSGVKTHVLKYEYALAIKANANRPKDWGHIATSLESAAPDKNELDSILSKYGLSDRWRRKIDE
jgi:predicted nucleotidyltransferase